MDPNTGRFVSEDPWEGDPEGPMSLHRFMYANGGPVNGYDPTGKFNLAWTSSTTAIVGILAATAIVSYANLLHKEKIDLHFNMDLTFKAQEYAIGMMMVMMVSQIVVDKEWEDFITESEAAKVGVRDFTKKLEKENPGRKYEILNYGPSDFNMAGEYVSRAVLNNWGNPSQSSDGSWYVDGGDKWGRLFGIGMWEPKLGWISAKQAYRYDDHPIDEKPFYSLGKWGTARYSRVYHYHLNNEKLHRVISGVPR